MKRRTILVAILLALILSGAIVWYFVFGEQAQRRSRPVEKLTLAAYAGDTAALIYIAEEQGYFKDNGLDIQIKNYEAGKLAADALLAGEADICTSADFVFVDNAFNGRDLRILGTVSTAKSCELIARKDRGIKKPIDLKGKRIGVTCKSEGEFFLGRFLLFNGLSLDDIIIVNLTPSEIISAISKGEIDAGFTWDPNIYKIRKNLGENAIAWPGQAGQDFYFLLISRENWIKNNSETVKRFLRAMLQAEENMKINNTEAKNFTQKEFKYEPAYINRSWLNHNFVVRLPQAMILALEDQARWKITNKLTDATEVPSYLNYIYLDALEEVKPEAVTIIR